MKKILCIVLSMLIIFSTFAAVGIVSFGVSDNISLSLYMFCKLKSDNITTIIV